MKEIEVILFSGSRNPSPTHVSYATLIRNNSFRSETNWDEIKVWVAQGNTVTIRPPTADESQSDWARVALERAERGY